MDQSVEVAGHTRGESRPALLEVRGLRKFFPVGGWFPGRQRRFIRAVDGVSFSLYAGETLGLVGESGSGKTTVGRLVLRLMQPTAGSILFEGQEITRLGARDLRGYRRHMQMVFQDPYTSLNPRLSVGKIIGEPLRINRAGSSQEIERHTFDLMEAVGLSPADASRLPHEFSGGQRQRIAIARALALGPRLVICDEPVSALDMSIQAKILNLLVDLQARFHLTYLFISHDLSVVRLVSDRVAVMYLGRIVEMGTASVLFAQPLHPYTQALMAAVPDPYVRSGVAPLAGEIPSNVDPPPGCHFHTRCSHRLPVCETAAPVLHEVAPGYSVACFLHHGLAEPAGSINFS